MKPALALLAAMALAGFATGQVQLLDETIAYDAAQPAAGFWLGNLQPGRFPDTWATLLIEPGDDGAFRAEMTALAAGVMNSPCAELSLDGSAVEFKLATRGVPVFRGEVSPDGQRYTGTITFEGADEPEGTFVFARTPRPTDLPRPLAYTGELTSQFGKLGMTLVFAETPGGNWVGQVDVPMQGLLGFPLVNVGRDGDTMTAELAVAPLPAAIEGTLVDEERRLAGRFRQGPFDLEIDFARVDDYAEPTLNRPQHPEPPYPYVVREVTIEHPDGHTLAGTLTLPDTAGPAAAVVLISGSGPQDRDETIFGHKPFLVIADYLTRHNIAVLRFDDRGTGASTGDFSSADSRDLATDVLAAMKFLAQVEGVDPKHIGLIGHSEGGIIAPMVASLTDDIAFMVLLAGTGVPGDEILRLQSALMMRASGATEQAIAEIQAAQEHVFEALVNGTEGEALDAALRPVVEKQLKVMTGLEGEALDKFIEQQMTQLASPWMRYFITYDPRPALARVQCPVLAVNGTLDLQVWHEQNLGVIEQTIREAGGDVTARRYEGLNHLFQPAETGSLAEYATIEVTFDVAVLRDMVEWIALKTGG